jgi:hypothetical protein
VSVVSKARAEQINNGEGVVGENETHPDNLLKLERAHLATVEVGARPYWVEHCEAGASRQMMIDVGDVGSNGWVCRDRLQRDVKGIKALRGGGDKRSSKPRRACREGGGRH